ncbi:MAG: hypothetical protein IJX49_06015 [Clostridia bacterium]|nr:hypothetical protein [Clostridia bacterium]
MGKANKSKKEKVPKITEEEYAAYLSSLKEETAVKAEDGEGIHSPPIGDGQSE